MSVWPPNDLEIAHIQEDIRALEPAERTAAYARLADYYGVAPATVRRVIPVGGRKRRVDAGTSRAAISVEAEEKIRQERKVSPGALVKRLSRQGEVEEGAISRDQARRIRDGKTVVGAPVPAPTPATNGSLTLKEWCEKHIVIRKKPWSLKRHEYLGEICDVLEKDPYVVVRKALQVGLTTLTLAETLYRCDTDGHKAIYFMPTADKASDFSDDRVGIMIDESDHLSQIVKERGKRGRDNKGLRHIGAGSHYIRGLFSEDDVTSVDGDIVVLDEIDIANQENRKYATGRVRHSDLQHVREICKPTIPGYGIDEIFQESDQRYFHLICPECGERTCLDHHLSDPKPVPIPLTFLPVPEGAWAKQDQKFYRACIHCRAPLDMSEGEWIPENPDARIVGFHVSALYTQICPPLFADPADAIMDELLSARTVIERKYATTSILGLPYGSGKDDITDDVLKSATGHHTLRPGRDTYIGIDQGDICHIVVLEEVDGVCEVAGLYITDAWEDLPGIYENNRGRCQVGDALPNKSEMKRAAKAVGGYICYYSLNKPVTVKEEGDVDSVVVDRTESLDETVRCLIEGEIVLPNPALLDVEGIALYETMCKHLKNLKKQMVEGAGGIARWQYLLNVENHFGMALNYARLAREVLPGARTLEHVETASYESVRQGVIDGARPDIYDHVSPGILEMWY